MMTPLRLEACHKVLDTTPTALVSSGHVWDGLGLFLLHPFMHQGPNDATCSRCLGPRSLQLGTLPKDAGTRQEWLGRLRTKWARPVAPGCISLRKRAPVRVLPIVNRAHLQQ